MNGLKRKLIQRAKKKYKKIYPCSYLKKLSECFTIDDNILYFWFNSVDHSTHIVKTKIV